MSNVHFVIKQRSLFCAGTFLALTAVSDHPRGSRWHQSNELNEIFRLVALVSPWVPWLMSEIQLKVKILANLKS